MAKAISLSPTQKFEGDDGQWSTFYLMIGNDPQAYRILPATSQSASWFIAADACNSSFTSAVPPNCNDLRGSTYNRSSLDPDVQTNEQTFDQGWYMPYTEAEIALDYSRYFETGYGANATITLGAESSDARIPNQLVAMPVDKSPFFGLLGLSGRSAQLSDSIDYPSALMASKISGKIPSLYWAYHAGAYWTDPPVLGSLTFGGYDSARGDIDSFVLPFYSRNDMEFLINIQSISISSASESVVTHTPSAPLNAFIDSMIPEIWLPRDLCQAFENDFGLVWNETYSLYLLSGDQHQNLLAMNPSVTFTLAKNTSSSSETTQIVLPYAAFDLQISLYDTGLNTSDKYNSTDLYYFPLKQAANSSQYVLGRTFLQAAYLTANYENDTFSISQAKLTQESNIVTVWTNATAPGNNNTALPVDQNSDGGLSSGAIAGIAVGSVIAAIAAFALFYWLCWRPRKRRGKATPPHCREGSMATFQTGTDTMVAPGDTWSRTQSTGVDPLWFVNDRKIADNDQEAKPELDATFTSRMRAPSEATQKHELPAGSVPWPSPGRGSISPMIEHRPGHTRTTSDTPSYGVSTLGLQSPPLPSPSPPLSESTGWLQPVYELHAVQQSEQVAPYEMHADTIQRLPEPAQVCPSNASTPKIIAEDPPRESISEISEIDRGNEVGRATTPSRPETPVAETGPGTRLL